MIFYHFTTRDALPSIMAEGLNRGEAPISDTRVAQAVNLTTSPDPEGHGLDKGGRVVGEAESAKLAAHGFRVPVGTIYADKLEARIKIKLPRSDRRLTEWRTWSRKHCEPGYADRLERAAGANRKPKTWWLYQGTIPPEAFVEVTILKPAPEDGPL